MPEDSQPTRVEKPEQGDKFIPPPMDPYATYQTPYERRQSPEPNPFIEFRRFADKQLSEMFSGFSTFANLPKMFGMDDGMKNLRDQLQKDFEEMVAYQKAFEERFKNAKNDTYSPVPPSATAAIQSTPSQTTKSTVEEVVTENKQKPVEDVSQDWITTTDDNGKKYRINLSTGHAVKQPSPEPSTPMVQPPEDPKIRWKRGFRNCPELKKYQGAVELDVDEASDNPKMRWRRGFRNCPELKKYQGETELDVYEALEDQQRSSQSTETSSRARPSWSSWLSAYGYDGKQKSKNTSEPKTFNNTNQEDDSSIRPCEVETYHFWQTRAMDPFRNDHEVMPWLLLSSYSPVHLARPWGPSVKSARMHNGCQGGCSRPMHPFDLQFQDRTISEPDDKLKAMLANKVSWQEAFEDLISLERTGQMPNREVDGRLHREKRPRPWMRDMVERGLLGPKWWIEDDTIMRDSRDDLKAHSPFMKRRATSAEREEQLRELQMRTRARMDALIPNILAMADRIEKSRSDMDEDWLGGREALQPLIEKLQMSQQAAASNDDALTASNFQTKETTSSEPSHSLTEVPTIPVQPEQQPSQPSAPKKSVISTMTTTTTRTLPDGSVETKRMLKQRFADGKEESEESTEIVHPPAPESTSGKKSPEQQKNQGWFWT